MSPAVIVCGSLNMDLVARVDHLPRPGETVVGASLQRLPGGKGLNQAVAAARMGAAVAMIGARGDDADGATLAALLASEGIDTRDLRVRDPRAMPDAHTGLAQVIVAADGENSIVVHGGANLTLTAEEVGAAFAVPSSATSGQEGSSPTEPPQAGPTQAPRVRVAPVRVALAQLETPLVAVAAFFEAARDAGVRTILNPAPAIDDALPLLADADLVVLNETELAIFSAAVAREAGADGSRPARPADAAMMLLQGRCQAVIVTLGAEGVWLVTGEDAVHFPAPAVTVVDTTGAGDCFCGVLAAGLAQGLDLEAAIARAVAAASLSVTRSGAAPAMPRTSELGAS
jgi:ribokinase